MVLVVVLLLLVMPACAAAQSGPSRVALYGSLGFDLITTEVAIRRGFQEGNPILRGPSAQRIGIALSATVATDALTGWLQRNGSRKLAAVLNFTIGSVHIVAGARNLKR